LKVGVKYCGGCNPSYDRVKTVKELEERLGGKVEFVSWRDENADGVVIVAGCPVSCVDGEPFAGRPSWRINGHEDLDGMVKSLEEAAGEKR